MTKQRQQIHLHGRESMLIILMGSLGDLVRGFCLPGLIKKQHPGVHISWLVEPRWKDLVVHHEQIDAMLVFDRPQGLKALPALRRMLRQRPFDITLDLQRHFKSGLFSLLSGSPHRLGFHPRNAKEFNWLFNSTHIAYFGEDKAKLAHYLQFAAAMGIDTTGPLNFGLGAIAGPKSAQRTGYDLPCPYVAVVLGSSWVTKNWHEDGYRLLVTHILRHMPFGIALVGDKSQMPMARRICTEIDDDRLVDLTGRTSLTELTAILSRAAAGIGPDSGPGHLAAAVGTPYVALFGPTPPGRVVPYRCEHLAVVTDAACAACYRKQCPLPECTCMHAITPAMVISKLQKALDGRPVTAACPN